MNLGLKFQILSKPLKSYSIVDRFTDTNGTAINSHTPLKKPSGSNWSQTVGTSFWIQSNQLQARRQTNADLAIIDSGLSDFSLSSDVIPFDDGTNAGTPGVVFRYVDTNNFWYVYFDSINGKFHLYKVSSGTSIHINQISQTLVSGTTYTVRIDCKGNNITIYFNGVEIFSYVDSFNNTATIVGVRYGKIGTGGVCSWDNFTVNKFGGLVLNWPLFTEYVSNPIVALGSGGSWEDSDVNDPNVIFDSVNNRYVLLYSGYKVGGGNVQALGLAYSTTLPGTWSKEAGNPVFTGGGVFGQNGGIVKLGTTYYYYYGTNTASQIACATSTDLINWTDHGVVLDVSSNKWDSNAVFDAFARLRQDGVTIELWYAGNTGAAGSNGIGFAISTDGLTFTKSSLNPIYADGNLRGEPSIFVPSGKEGVEALLSFDDGGIVGTRVISQLITLNNWKSYHKRYGALIQGSGWESNQVFDSFIYPTIVSNTMYLFHSGANTSGGALGLNSEIGVASAPWTFSSLAA